MAEVMSIRKSYQGQMPNRASAFKVRAYQLFKSGVPLREIPQKVGCSKSLIYRWASQEQWASPWQSSLARIESVAQKIEVGDDMAWLTEAFRSKLPERLAELEEACKKGNVTAILAWIKYAGAQPPKPEDRAAVIR